MHNDVPNFADQAPSTDRLAADKALFIVRALQWLQTKVVFDTNREDIDDFLTLNEIGLEALEKELEMTRQALSVCRIAEPAVNCEVQS
jgi:hypothetical protein